MYFLVSSPFSICVCLIRCMILFIKKKKKWHEHFFPVVSTLLLGFRSIISPLTLMREKIYISLCSFLLDINCLALLIWHSLFGHGPIGALDRAHPNNKFVNYSNFFSLSDLFFFFFFPLQKFIKLRFIYVYIYVPLHKIYKYRKYF